MPQFSIPDSHSHATFLSPRKSLIAVGFVCALSAVALLAGRTPAPAVDADNRFNSTPPTAGAKP
jgi:hypothetical protein